MPPRRDDDVMADGDPPASMARGKPRSERARYGADISSGGERSGIEKDEVGQLRRAGVLARREDPVRQGRVELHLRMRAAAVVMVAKDRIEREVQIRQRPDDRPARVGRRGHGAGVEVVARENDGVQGSSGVDAGDAGGDSLGPLANISNDGHAQDGIAALRDGHVRQQQRDGEEKMPHALRKTSSCRSSKSN